MTSPVHDRKAGASGADGVDVSAATGAFWVEEVQDGENPNLFNG